MYKKTFCNILVITQLYCGLQSNFNIYFYNKRPRKSKKEGIICSILSERIRTESKHA